MTVRLPRPLLDGTWRSSFHETFTDPTNLRRRWELRGDDYAEGRSRSRSDWAAVTVAGGQLRLRAVMDPLHGPGWWLAGHIGTRAFEFIDGWAAAKIRFHPHQGHHSAFWLQTTEDYVPGQAEVDIVEWFGAHNPSRRKGTEVHHNVYWRPPGMDAPDFTGKSFATSSVDYGLSDGWPAEAHIYSVRWEPRFYEFWIDDKPVGRITEGLSDRPKQLVVSMIGRDYEVGLMELDKLGSYEDVVDWVRVWKRR